jgi:hypothetical protein
MQRREAIKSARTMVVLALYRWTKMLVRRQSDDAEIIIAVGSAGVSTTQIQCSTKKRSARDGYRSVRFTSVGT